jgi:hypothetical protein
MKLIIKGWKKTKDTTYSQHYERRIGNALVKVWWSDPEKTFPFCPTYRWTIERDDSDFSVTSRGTYESAEEAAAFAETGLTKQVGMNTHQWTKKWPTKAGRYWFYGWPYGQTKKVMSDEPIAPELNMVDIWEVNNGITFVREGQFWSKNDGGIGLFCEAILPDLPDLGGLDAEHKKGKIK